MVPNPVDDRTGPVPTPPWERLPAPRRAADESPVVDETSAGGLVVDYSRSVPRVAVIARRNRAGRLEWCLPKGHLEGDETPEEAAVREIAEETGITGRIRTHVGTIDYWFSGQGRRVHKVVHHFVLDYVSGHLTTENDPDAEAEDVAWIAVPDLPERLAYPNERRLAQSIADLVRGTAAELDTSGGNRP